MATAPDMNDMEKWQFKQMADQINQKFEYHHQKLGKARHPVRVNPSNEYIIVKGESEQEVTAKRVAIFRRQVDYGYMAYRSGWEEVTDWISSSECAKWCMENAAVPLHLIYQQNHASMAWNFAILAYFEPKVLTAYLLKWPEQ